MKTTNEITQSEIAQFLPAASPDCIRVNADNILPNPKPKYDKKTTLGKAVQGEKSGVERIKVSFTLYRIKLLDPDNAAGSVKDLLDGLRHSGLIADDDWKSIRLSTGQEKVNHFAEEKTVVKIKYPTKKIK